MYTNIFRYRIRPLTSHDSETTCARTINIITVFPLFFLVTPNLHSAIEGGLYQLQANWDKNFSFNEDSATPEQTRANSSSSVRRVKNIQQLERQK